MIYKNICVENRVGKRPGAHDQVEIRKLVGVGFQESNRSYKDVTGSLFLCFRQDLAVY